MLCCCNQRVQSLLRNRALAMRWVSRFSRMVQDIFLKSTICTRQLGTWLVMHMAYRQEFLGWYKIYFSRVKSVLSNRALAMRWAHNIQQEFLGWYEISFSRVQSILGNWHLQCNEHLAYRENILGWCQTLFPKSRVQSVPSNPALAMRWALSMVQDIFLKRTICTRQLGIWLAMHLAKGQKFLRWLRHIFKIEVLWGTLHLTSNTLRMSQFSGVFK